MRLMIGVLNQLLKTSKACHVIKFLAFTNVTAFVRFHRYVHHVASYNIRNELFDVLLLIRSHTFNYHFSNN